jgi:hypothetical protein
MSAALNITVETSDLCEIEFIRARMADFITPVRLILMCEANFLDGHI